MLSSHGTGGAVAVVGHDVLLEARPAHPLQLSQALEALGFDAVVPETWGEEVLAKHMVEELAAHHTVVLSPCEHAEAMIRAATWDRPVHVLHLAHPAIITARYLRRTLGQAPIRVSYVGRWHGRLDPEFEAVIGPARMLGTLQARGIPPSRFPAYYESVLPPDRRRHWSLPGGLPHGDMHGTLPGAFVSQVVTSRNLSNPLSRRAGPHRILVTMRPGCGCNVAGLGASVARGMAIMAIEPPRSEHPVVDHGIRLELGPANEGWERPVAAPPAPFTVRPEEPGGGPELLLPFEAPATSPEARPTTRASRSEARRAWSTRLSRTRRTSLALNDGSLPGSAKDTREKTSRTSEVAGPAAGASAATEDRLASPEEGGTLAFEWLDHDPSPEPGHEALAPAPTVATSRGRVGEAAAPATGHGTSALAVPDASPPAEAEAPGPDLGGARRADPGDDRWEDGGTTMEVPPYPYTPSAREWVRQRHIGPSSRAVPPARPNRVLLAPGLVEQGRAGVARATWSFAVLWGSVAAGWRDFPGYVRRTIESPQPRWVHVFLTVAAAAALLRLLLMGLEARCPTCVPHPSWQDGTLVWETVEPEEEDHSRMVPSNRPDSLPWPADGASAVEPR